MEPESPREHGNGVEVSGYGASLKAYGRNAIIFAGFLTMAGALLVDGWLTRQDRVAQTKLLTEVMAGQKTFIDGYISKASADHIDLKALCLKERFADQLHTR